ncbi:hypothetical protein D5085_12210 [Ectothiorhodospiraceae bacterium BW-2]|nr:hypothetical protein D5085_12210 [Ectothiorhodospiraceae bacterium BW-2]
MIIFETTVFTKIIHSLMPDDEYRLLQNHIIESPDTGELIKGSGGLRKVHWKLQGRGKRGGVRVIYYWAINDDQIFMLYEYPKSEQENLTHEQLSALKKLVESEFR